MNRFTFLREPAFWTHAAATAAVILATLLPSLSSTEQGWWDGVIAGIAGLVVAYLTHDGIFAAALGLLQGAFMVILGYHWVPFLAGITPEQMIAVFTALSALAAGYTRTQAIAPKPPIAATVGTVVPPPAPRLP